MATKAARTKKPKAPPVETAVSTDVVVDPHALTPDEQYRMDRAIWIATVQMFWPEGPWSGAPVPPPT